MMAPSLLICYTSTLSNALLDRGSLELVQNREAELSR